MGETENTLIGTSTEMKPELKGDTEHSINLAGTNNIQSNLTHTYTNPRMYESPFPNHSSKSNAASNTSRNMDLHIPIETLSNIISLADKSALATLMRVSHTIYDIAATYLYREITITKINAEKLFVGLPRAIRRNAPKKSRQVRVHNTEDPLDQPVRLLWPAAILESDDEEEKEDGEDRNMNSLVPTETQFNYPTRRSEQRKRDLLKNTTMLFINTRFSNDLCNEIQGWAYSSDGNFQPVFMHLKNLAITAQAIREWADWNDRHICIGQGMSSDPFEKILSKIGKADHRCMTLPIYTQQDYTKYFRNRTMYDLEPPSHRRAVIIRSRYKYMVTVEVPKLTQSICEMYKPNNSATLHNVTNGNYQFYIYPSTIFFAPYSTSSNSLTCKYQKLDQESRGKLVEELSIEFLNWGFLSLGSNIEYVFPDDEKDDLNWTTLKRTIREKVSAPKRKRGTLRFSGFEDVSPCNACKTREGLTEK